MRVLIFARNTVAHPHFGGMEVVLDVLSRELEARGHHLALVTTSGFDEVELSARYDSVWAVPTKRPGRYSRAWWQATSRIGNWDTWAPDVALGIGDAGGGYASRTGRGVPVVTQAHGTPVMEAASALGLRTARGAAQAALNVARLPSRKRYFRNADEVWAISESVQASLLRLGIGPQGVRLMPNAIDSSAFRFSPSDRERIRGSNGLPPAARVAISLGRLDRQKGVDFALRVADCASDPFSLLVAGTGDDESRLRAVGAALQHPHRVSFVGHVPRSDLAAVLSAADVLLLPSRRREGLPMVILEAAASGLPLIGSPHAGIPRDVVATGRARVLPLADPAAWSGAVSELTHANKRESFLPPTYELFNYGDLHVQGLQRLANIRPR